MKFLIVILTFCLFITFINAIPSNDLALRFKRTPKECQYEKGPWEECDENGTQKRQLKLKPNSVGTNCPKEKFIQRTCKKSCKYDKGEWSECKQGTRFRVDPLKVTDSSIGCPEVRNITKQCKEQCKYAKNTDWSPCENGKKSKTLTLIGKDSSPACEPTKEVIKECRKKSKSRPKNKKNNSNVPTDNSE